MIPVVRDPEYQRRRYRKVAMVDLLSGWTRKFDCRLHSCTDDGCCLWMIVCFSEARDIPCYEMPEPCDQDGNREESTQCSLAK